MVFTADHQHDNAEDRIKLFVFIIHWGLHPVRIN